MPKRVTGILSALSLLLVGCLCFYIFQSGDFRDVDNSL